MATSSGRLVLGSGWRGLRLSAATTTTTTTTRAARNHGGFYPTATTGTVRGSEQGRGQRRWNGGSSFAKRRGKAVEPVASETTQAEPSSSSAATTTTSSSTPTPTPTPQSQVQSSAATSEQNRPSKEPENRRLESTVKSIVKTEDAGTVDRAAAEALKRNNGHQNQKVSEEKDTSSSSSKVSTTSISPLDSSSSSNPATDPTDTTERTIRQEGGPLEEVLHRETPAAAKAPRQHPHMSPPPYVHHFDSYSLVKQLQEGGYTQGQAIEAMKGIRALLAQNLDRAQESLVSKSDVENETYLFSAACSELGQEIKNNRRLQDEQIRQQRTLLQHEVDILTQSLNQEASTLNDNVRGMFNDRRMAVREEQKTADSAVQQINYKISTSLGSDSKSEIEGVRWILIRRSALGIFVMAMLTLGTLRYATYRSSERQKELDRKKEQEELQRREAGKRDHSSAADAAAILAAN